MKASEEKASFMPSGTSGTNTVTKEAVDASLLASTVAMELWLKNGTVPAEYMRKLLGDPAQGVIVQPAAPAAPQPPSTP